MIVIDQEQIVEVPAHFASRVQSSMHIEIGALRKRRKLQRQHAHLDLGADVQLALHPFLGRRRALEVLEGLLFQLIAAGFILLTVSLGSGMIFINDLFAQHLAHKTILSIVAWLVFGTLLWGRRFRGWRGRVAVRMTLAGILLLLLSYFGTKLVLEVLLERSWQT